MRADVEKNYRHLITVARDAIVEHGADASLRDIARRANVGFATLYRHFPTREALLGALLRTDLDGLTQKAAFLEASESAVAALKSWFRDAVAFTRTYSGVVTLMAAALEDEGSAVHASCAKVRSAGTRLLQRSQSEGTSRTDLDGMDLFALMGAIAWIAEQSAFASRVDHLSDVIVDTILSEP